MFIESFNNEFGLPSLLDFDSNRPNSLFDFDFDASERMPDFELEPTLSRCLEVPAPVDIPCDRSEKNQTDVDTKSTSEHCQMVLMTKGSRSVHSFDSEGLGSDDLLPALAKLDPSPDSFDKILLRMVDQESLDFLQSLSGPVLTAELKEFLACNIEVMTKTPFPSIPEESTEQFIQRANAHLKNTTQKRKDQKLRMIFNKIVKMLVNSSGKKDSGRESKASRLEGFLEKYAPKNKPEFESFIKDCKFPSKKKLKSIFMKYSQFRKDFDHILTKKIFYNEYLQKRMLKAQKLVSNFKEAHSKYGTNRSKIVASLRDCIKSFPWSTEDLTTSCTLLHSTLGDESSLGF